MPPVSSCLIEILERQSFNDGIPAGLPAGARVAQKTGEITHMHHDAGIVFCAHAICAGNCGPRPG